VSRRAFVGRANGRRAYRTFAADLDDGANTALGRPEPVRVASPWRVASVRSVAVWMASTFGARPQVVEYDGATLLRAEVADRDEERRWSLWVVDDGADLPIVLDDRITAVVAVDGPSTASLNASGLGVIVADASGVRQVGDRRLWLRVTEPHREVAAMLHDFGGSGGGALMRLMAISFRRRELRSLDRAREWARWNRSHRRRYLKQWVAANAEHVREQGRAWRASAEGKARRAASSRRRLDEQKAARNTPDAIAARAARSAELREARKARAREAARQRYATDLEFRARRKAATERYGQGRNIAANARGA